MKYFVIEIVKPQTGEKYRSDLMRKIEQCDFDVISVSDKKEDAEKECVKAQIQNVKNQSGLHHEILEGEGNSALMNKYNELKDFYRRVQ